MNRIDNTFTELKKAGKKGLVGYLTAGDPDAATSMKNIRTAIENGLDVLELGVPFSDPTADGPTIQAASHRALSAGMTVDGVLDMVSKLRADYDIPIILFGYANPFFHYGYAEFCKKASAAGADGMLVVDLPYEEREELNAHLEDNDMAFINLIAPTTPSERAGQILDGAKGFVYYIMVTGVTGQRDAVEQGVEEHVLALREATDLPVAVGFGISNGEQARVAAKNADAVVAGSALIKAAGDGTLGDLVKELKGAL